MLASDLFIVLESDVSHRNRSTLEDSTPLYRTGLNDNHKTSQCQQATKNVVRFIHMDRGALNIGDTDQNAGTNSLAKTELLVSTI